MDRDDVRILIVDDEPNMRYSFERILKPKFQVISALSAEEAIEVLGLEHPDVIVMDIKMEGMDGIEALQKIRELDPNVPVIIMTAYGTVNTAIRAMKYGAYEYLLKPFNVDKMRRVIESAVRTATLRPRQVDYEFAPNQTKKEIRDVIIGNSDRMQEVYKLIGQVATQKVTALIFGESGTGKELVARAIYRHSKRRSKPFVELNCAALPETLLESELFGYEKGAFTGAVERRIGKFEQADGGTMFLDEIGEMTLQTQAKILRVIQSGEITRLGGNQVIDTDVRLLVATNRNLEEKIRKGEFRDDLYYRLNVISIQLPPLRERRKDIPELVDYFLARFTAEMGKTIKGIDKKASHKLSKHPWPGNVRELENCIRRAVVLAKSEIVTSEDLHLDGSSSPYRAPGEDDEEALDRIIDRVLLGLSDTKLIPTVEKILITKALEKSGGNQVQAARILGINRNTLRNRIEKYSIKK